MTHIIEQVRNFQELHFLNLSTQPSLKSSATLYRNQSIASIALKFLTNPQGFHRNYSSKMYFKGHRPQTSAAQGSQGYHVLVDMSQPINVWLRRVLIISYVLVYVHLTGLLTTMWSPKVNAPGVETNNTRVYALHSMWQAKQLQVCAPKCQLQCTLLFKEDGWLTISNASILRYPLE